MASSFRIRQQNFVEMQKNLDAVNSVLKSSIRLRGKWQNQCAQLMKKKAKFNYMKRSRIICSGKMCGKNDAVAEDQR